MSLDLSVNYGGLLLPSPLVVGSCPMTIDDQTRLSLELAGAGAIVLQSIFEEQISDWDEHHSGGLAQPGLDQHTHQQHLIREQSLPSSELRLNAPNLNTSLMDAKGYLALVNRSSSQLAIPVIASINGSAAECTVEFASELQEAGAAGIELNLRRGAARGFKGAGEIEESLLLSIEAFSRAISVPLFVKLDPGGVSLPHLARRCCSGMAGVVMHGRSPDVDICLDTLRLCTQWTLSHPGTSIQLIEPIIRLHSQCPTMSIAASGGIATCEGVAKVLLAGADVAMVTSELYRSGPDAIRKMLDGLIVFLERHRFGSLRELQMNRPLEFTDPEARSHYVSALSNRLNTPSPRPRKRGQIASVPSQQKPYYRELGQQECDRWGHLVSEVGEPTGSPE